MRNSRIGLLVLCVTFTLGTGGCNSIGYAAAATSGVLLGAAGKTAYDNMSSNKPPTPPEAKEGEPSYQWIWNGKDRWVRQRADGVWVDAKDNATSPPPQEEINKANAASNTAPTTPASSG